jgi:uncharacterized membrane protein
VGRLGRRAAALALALAGAGQGAWAELRICNDTAELQSIALGYKGAGDWLSRGWWNIQPGDCATVVSGPLNKRYYYYFADSPSKTFRGQNYHFCADDRVFEILGDTDCVDRGHQRLNFREIDVGDTATAYTLTLQASKSSGAGVGVKAPGGGASSGGGLGTQLVSEVPAPMDLGVAMASPSPPRGCSRAASWAMGGRFAAFMWATRSCRSSMAARRRTTCCMRWKRWR